MLSLHDFFLASRGEGLAFLKNKKESGARVKTASGPPRVQHMASLVCGQGDTVEKMTFQSRFPVTVTLVAGQHVWSVHP